MQQGVGRLAPACRRLSLAQLLKSPARKERNGADEGHTQQCFHVIRMAQRGLQPLGGKRGGKAEDQPDQQAGRDHRRPVGKGVVRSHHGLLDQPGLRFVAALGLGGLLHTGGQVVVGARGGIGVALQAFGLYCGLIIAGYLRLQLAQLPTQAGHLGIGGAGLVLQPLDNAALLLPDLLVERGDLIVALHQGGEFRPVFGGKLRALGLRFRAAAAQVADDAGGENRRNRVLPAADHFLFGRLNI